MHNKLNHIAIGALALIAIATGSGAHAQASLDQNRALAGSVTPGDVPGFPISISLPGAYKLTGNLVVPAGQSGIEILSSGVTLDLNGFGISGAGVCVRNNSTFDVACFSINTGTVGADFKVPGNTLRNGRVRGFDTGVSFVGADQIENLLVENNNTGVSGSNDSGGARSLVNGVRSQFNAKNGFSLSNTLVQGASAGGNGQNGFFGFHIVVLDSVAFDNKTAGITGNNNSAVGRSVASGNKGGNIVQATSLGSNLDGFAF